MTYEVAWSGRDPLLPDRAEQSALARLAAEPVASQPVERGTGQRGGWNAIPAQARGRIVAYHRRAKAQGVKWATTRTAQAFAVSVSTVKLLVLRARRREAA
jgi:hypothetical protein